MKRLILIVSLFFTLNLFASQIVILHTNDLHSMFQGVGPHALYSQNNGEFELSGHFARLAQVINEQRQNAKDAHHDVLLVDAGDFYGGTLFQVLGPDKSIEVSPEIDFFLNLDYDFVTVGNHEFDAGEDGFLNLISKRGDLVKERGLLASSNITLPKNHPLKEFIIPHKVIQTASAKIGLIGLLGPDGARVCATLREEVSFVGFDDERMSEQWNDFANLTQKKVHFLKEEKGVDIIIVVMHGGHPEDEQLAKDVNGIDVIIAGHTHKAYKKVLNINGTWISQSGSFGENLGKLVFKKTEDGLLLQNNGKHLVPITNKIERDQYWEEKIKSYQELIDHKLQTERPYEDFLSSTLVTHIDESFERSKEWSTKVTSLIRAQKEKELKEEIGLYFTSQGLIRSGLSAPVEQTPILFSDLFQVLSISVPEDNLYGAQTVRFYFEKCEVRRLVRFLHFYERISRAFAPAFSDDLTYEIPKIRIPYIREVKNLRWRGLRYRDWPDLIPVATNSVLASYLPHIGSLSKGLIKFTPKDKDGNPLEDLIINGPREVYLLAQALKEKNEK